MENNAKVLLVSNYWNGTNVLSFLIRIVGYGINHAAILVDGTVHEMRGSNYKWVIKKLLGKEVSYEANQGSGYTTTPYDKWLTTSNRKVKIMGIKKEVNIIKPEIKEGYGFLDLIQILLYIIRVKWLMIGNDWNGKDGCRLWEGDFCSEFTGKWIGEKDCHILLPIDLLSSSKLVYESEIRTYKT